MLVEFSRICKNEQIKPVLVFIPTVLQIYGRYYTADSPPKFLANIGQQLKYETNSEEALARIADELEVQLIDLVPTFRDFARRGILLYYPFDSHWNSRGKQAAAEAVAKSLLSQIP